MSKTDPDAEASVGRNSDVRLCHDHPILQRYPPTDDLGGRRRRIFERSRGCARVFMFGSAFALWWCILIQSVYSADGARLLRLRWLLGSVPSRFCQGGKMAKHVVGKAEDVGPGM
ncbi:hypothetical protein, partial [Mesorhizobium sp. M0244]|uniref:hypothetical protein n=1 Tax=Mesorhizobium sp. M0244 TaxID=2956926 RepID=UPI003339918A